MLQNTLGIPQMENSLQKTTRSLWTAYWPLMSPCVKESQCLCLHYWEVGQYISGGGLLPLLSPGKTHLECWVHFWAPQCQGNMGTLEWAQQRWPAWLGAGAHDIRGETLRLRSVCLEEKEVIAAYNYLMGEPRNLRSWSLELVRLWAGGWTESRCLFKLSYSFFMWPCCVKAKTERKPVCLETSTWWKEK